MRSKAWVALLGVVALVLLAACTDPGKALNDDAACPGETCTDDTRARLDAIAALDGVTEVERVARTYSFDNGPFREASLRASVGSQAEARDLALEVLAVLEDWPEHDSGGATVTVEADPEVVVDYVGHAAVEMSRAPFEPCSDPACEDELREVRDRVTEDYDGVEELRLQVEGDLLQVTGSTSPEQAEHVARSVEVALIEVGARIAARARIEIRARGPLVVTLRLDDGLVCEQPRGTRGACDESNSLPFPES